MLRRLIRSCFGFLIVAAAVPLFPHQAQTAEPIKALIVDGQNNHAVWPTTTKMMKKYLEETKLFTVDVATSCCSKNCDIWSQVVKNTAPVASGVLKYSGFQMYAIVLCSAS